MNSKLFSALVVAVGLLLLGGNLRAADTAPSWKLTFTHRAGKSEVDFNSAANRQALAELDAIFASPQSRKISRIEIKSYSSPEGRLAWNTKLAGMRSEGVRQMVEGLLDGNQAPEFTENNVPEDWDAAKTYLRLTDKPWKEEALKILASGDAGRKEKMEDLWAGEAWDDLIWNCFYAVRRTEVIISFEPDTQFSESSESVSEQEFSVKFPVGSTSIADSYLGNAAVLAGLKSLANTVNAEKTLVLDAYSSPEGRASWNLVLARRRAEAVKAYLVSQGVPADRIEVRTIQEDWDGLAGSVKSGWFGAGKDEILAIIADSSTSSAEKENQMRALAGGQVWNRLVSSSWMQELRRVDVRLE